MSEQELIEEVVADLTIELNSDADFSENILRVKVKAAIREFKNRRNYIATSMDETAIGEDMEQFYSTILDVSRYDYNQRGVEGQLAHSDNGVSRTWQERNKLWMNVHPFLKVM